MYLVKKNAGRIFLLALTLTLAACKPANTAQTTPTVDPNTIYTAAAKTVQAQLTSEAVLNPPATATEAPTATLSVPTADLSFPTLAVPGQATSALPQAGTQAVATLTPIATLAGANAPAPARSFQWISNEPADGAVVVAGTKFDIVWTVKNTGTSTWTTAYTYGYFSGSKYFDKLRYNLKSEVKPGAEGRIIVDAVAPSSSGEYYTWWKLINDQGQNLGDMDLKITVVQAGETPKAPTATTKP